MGRALKALAASGMIVGIRGKSALALPGVSGGMGFIASNKSMHLVRARPELPSSSCAALREDGDHVAIAAA